jgi:arginyl-tRNA synthetase
MLPGMKSIREELEAAVSRALVTVVGPEGAGIDPQVRPTQDPKFGDYQSNVALGLKKRLGRSPREVAESLAAALDLGEVCEPAEIAGPGFLNFRLKPSHLAARLTSLQSDPRLGVPAVERPQRVVVDFSGPNVAKEMHVGHLRSTIIGDTIARLLEFQGHDVLRLNHVGDWGTQFGMLIQHLRESRPEVAKNPESSRLADLEQFYVEAKRRFDSEPAFAEAARRAVVELQAGEPTARKLWGWLCAETMRHVEEIYRRLDIRIETRGESFYNPMLPQVVEELQQQGLAVEDQGALCVFLEGWESPAIIRKTDGGYNYDTTDLAAVKHRVQVEKADRIIYVTDIRQHEHFEKVFAAARKAGWAPEQVSLEHVGFGMVLGKDRKPIKTRDGGTVKLKNLLEEAEVRAAAAIQEAEQQRGEDRRRVLNEEQKQEIAGVVGRGAVKYADLSHNVSSDYVFDWDTMLALEGNTVPYLLYACARVRSIGRRAGVDFEALPADLALVIEHPSEIGLAKELLNFPAVLQQVSRELRPHHLTDYLYSLSRAFSTFFDRERGVRVVDAEPENVRQSRLRLCDLTARTLERGLDLLGIKVLEQM